MHFCLFFLSFFFSQSPSGPVACFPSAHADGAIQRIQKVWCPQGSPDSVASPYRQTAGEMSEQTEATFGSVGMSRLTQGLCSCAESALR